MKERKLKDKEKLEQALKQRETEEATENTSKAICSMTVQLKKSNFSNGLVNWFYQSARYSILTDLCFIPVTYFFFFFFTTQISE